VCGRSQAAIGVEPIIRERSVYYSAPSFSPLSYLVAMLSLLPVKVFNCTSTLYKGSISYDTPILHALGTVGLFTVLASSGLDTAGVPSLAPRTEMTDEIHSKIQAYE